jgi:hypothetical protein
MWMLSCLNSIEDLEGLKVVSSELRVWITIHIIDVTFKYLDSCYWIVHKNVYHLCKLNESMHKLK